MPSGYLMAENSQVRFKQTVRASAGGVDIAMCGEGRSCSSVTILGVADGIMGERWNATLLTNTGSTIDATGTTVRGDKSMGHSMGIQHTSLGNLPPAGFVGRGCFVAIESLSFNFVSYRHQALTGGHTATK